AIASSEGRLNAESVRQLIGIAPSGVLEEIMGAVARSSSEEILQTVDRLLTEGQNPVHFARQLVRFLRNAIVAKVAGPDSALLQISADERTRIGRVAEMFSEEDLARHLQIMLRTHAELGYRQEQRFHLELGLLKLAHAQRLLPIEQLLTGAELTRAVSGDRNPTLPPQPKRPDPNPPRPFVSPFAADTARKGTPRSEISEEVTVMLARPNPAAVSGRSVIMGAAAPAVAPQKSAEAKANPGDCNQLRTAVHNALASAGQTMLASMLENGEWQLVGSEVMVRVAASASLIDISVSN